MNFNKKRGFRSDTIYELLEPGGRDAIFQAIQDAIQNKQPTLIYTFQVRHKLGHYIWREDSTNFRYDSAGEFDGAYVISRDITERKRLEEKVRQLAYFDPLTQLPNRRMLTDRLAQALALSKRSGYFVAVMVLDLDNFKPLNDLHGHMVGDLLLQQVADRLLGCVREADSVARFGGDEFVVVLNGLNADQALSAAQALAVAEKIRQALAAPYVLSVCKEGQLFATVEHQCSSSIGVALLGPEAADPLAVLEHADEAMYQAKAAGRNQVAQHMLAPPS